MVASVQGVQEVAILAVTAPGQMAVRLQDALPHFHQLQVFHLRNHCHLHNSGTKSGKYTLFDWKTFVWQSNYQRASQTPPKGIS